VRELFTTLGDLVAGGLLVAGIAVHDVGAALATAGLVVGALSTHAAGLWFFPAERGER
jgi:hypothetical protein